MILPIALAQATPELPKFQFRDVVAGEIVSPDRYRKCDKSKPKITCLKLDDEVAGKPFSTTISYFNDKLSSVFIEGSQKNYPALLDAFNARYGQPCKTEESRWRNAMGADLPNVTTTWCFATGELQLVKLGYRLDQTIAFYGDDQNEPPKEAPKVDF